MKSDITTFTVAEVKKLPQFSAMAQEIQQVLIDGASGMFLWVSLILDDLKNSYTTKPRIIREKLRTLPSTLPDIYKDILRKIEPENQSAANTILQWVVWAVRPLTIKELTIATAIRPHDTSLSTMEDEMELDMKTALRLIFGPMLKIEANDTVHLIHQSAKDFFRSNNSPGEPLPFWSISCTESNHLLATGCLTYLSFDELECGPVTFEVTVEHDRQLQILENRKLENEFLSYAAEHWFDHTRQTDHGAPDLRRTFSKLAKSGPKINLAYQIFLNSQKKGYGNTAPLHIAAEFGFNNFVEDLLDSSADINAQTGIYGTALQAAAVGGHETVVHLLLDRGADVNAQGGQYGTALMVASAESHEAIVRLLLDRGADIDVYCDGIFGNALLAAATEHDEAIVRLLLDRGANVNSQGGIFDAGALRAASFHSSESIVRLLLDRGADVNLQDCIVGTALQAAAARGNDVIVRLLLDRGADINMQSGMNYNAIEAAAKNGNEAIIHLLLDRGADGNISVRMWCSAVNTAAQNGNWAILDHLLGPGPNISGRGWKCSPALMNDRETLVHLLLDGGAHLTEAPLEDIGYYSA